VCAALHFTFSGMLTSPWGHVTSTMDILSALAAVTTKSYIVSNIYLISLFQSICKQFNLSLVDGPYEAHQTYFRNKRFNTLNLRISSY
jgi:hypothetical protein